MRNSILVLLVLAACVGAVQRQWKSSSSTDMNDSANYTGSGALLETDTLVFDDSSDVNATATAALSVAGLSITSDYSGTFNDGGQAFTISGLVTIASGGAFTATGTWTQDADANFSFNCTGTATVTSWQIDLQGTGTLTVSKSGAILAKITIAASSKTTTIGATVTVRSLYIGAGTVSIGDGIYLAASCTAGDALSFNSSHMITGTGNLIIQPVAAITLSIPRINASGLLNLFIRNDANVTATLSHQGNVTGKNFYWYKSDQGATTITTNNYTITATSLVMGNNNGVSGLTYNMGSSSIVSTGGFNTTSYNVGSTTINAETSTWAVAGDFDFGSNTTFNRGTSQVTLDGTTAVTLTSAGETFYDIVVAKTANRVTLQDSLKVDGDLDVNDGAFFQNGKVIVVAGDVMFDQAGDSLILDSTVTMTGASGDFHIGSGVGTVTATSLSLVMKGTGNLDIDKTGLTVKSLDLAYAGKTTTHTSATALSAAALIFNGDTKTAGTFTNSQTLTVTGASDYTFSPRGGTIAGTGSLLLYINAVNGTMTVDSITFTGTGTIVLGAASANASTVNMAGNISATSGTIRLYKNGNGPVTINTNDYSIAANSLVIGNQRSTDTLKVNVGASVVSVGALNNTTYNAGVTTLNLQTSTWAVGGDFDIGSNTTIDRGTSQITFNGTTAVTLTSAGETFYDLVIAKTANGVTLQDSLKCRSLDINDGDFDMNEQPIIVSGDIDWDSDGTFTGDGVLSITANSAIDLAGQTVSRLLLADGITATWMAGGTTTVTNYTTGDIDGSAGSLVTLVSSTPETAYNLNWPGDTIEVSYVNVTDCDASGGALVLADDGTSVNSGNNTNWSFHDDTVIVVIDTTLGGPFTTKISVTCSLSVGDPKTANIQVTSDTSSPGPSDGSLTIEPGVLDTFTVIGLDNADSIWYRIYIGTTDTTPWLVADMRQYGNVYWNGASNSYKLATNWSEQSGVAGQVGPPTVYDTAIFDDGDVSDMQLDTNVYVSKIIITNGYSGVWRCGGNNITVFNGASFAGTDTVEITDTLTVTGDNVKLYFDNKHKYKFDSLGTVIQFTGNNDTLDYDTLAFFHKLHRLTSTGDTLTIAGVANSATTKFFGFLNFDLTNVLRCIGHLIILPRSADALTFDTNAKIMGSAGFYIRIDGGGTFNIPKLSYTNTNTSISMSIWTLHLLNSDTAYVNFNGANTDTSALFVFRGHPTTAGVSVFRFGDSLYSTTSLKIGCLSSNGKAKYYFGGSEWDIEYDIDSTYNKLTEIYLDSSTISIGASLLLASNFTVPDSGGNSTIIWDDLHGTFSDDKFSGNTLNNGIINKSGNSAVFADTARFKGNFTVTAGGFNLNGKPMRVLGNLTINSDGTVIIDTTISVGGDLTFGESSNATITNADFVLSKDGSVITSNGKNLPRITINNNAFINDGCTIDRLIIANDKQITFESGETFVMSNYTNGDWSGSNDNIITFVSSTPSSSYTIDIPNDIAVSYINPADCQITGGVIDVGDGTSVNGTGNSGWLWPVSIDTLSVNKNSISWIFDWEEDSLFVVCSTSVEEVYNDTLTDTPDTIDINGLCYNIGVRCDVRGNAADTTSDSVTTVDWELYDTPINFGYRTRGTATWFPVILVSNSADSCGKPFKGSLSSPTVTAFSYNAGGDSTEWVIDPTDKLVQYTATGIWKLLLSEEEANPNSGLDSIGVIRISDENIHTSRYIITRWRD